MVGIILHLELNLAAEIHEDIGSQENKGKLGLPAVSTRFRPRASINLVLVAANLSLSLAKAQKATAWSQAHTRSKTPSRGGDRNESARLRRRRQPYLYDCPSPLTFQALPQHSVGHR